MKKLEFYVKNLFDEKGPWITYIRNKGYNVTGKTLKNKKAILNLHIIPYWGQLKPDQITIKKINEALFAATSIQTGKPLSFSTKNSIMFQLSCIFSYLIEEGLLIDNIIHKVKKFNSAPQKPRGIILEFDLMRLFPESHESLLFLWRNQMFVCAFLIMRDTGMRNNEVLALKWSDLYKEYGIITVLRAIEAGTKDKENKTKTGKSRVVLLSSQSLRELEIYRKQKRAWESDYIFCRDDMKPIFGQRLTTAFRLAVKRAGINRPDYTPYWLRHTFASNLMDSYPLDLVRRLMGHTNIDTTLDYRSRNVESLLKEGILMKALKENGQDINFLQMVMIQRQMEQSALSGIKPQKINILKFMDI